jgi:hypothetical protein
VPSESEDYNLLDDQMSHADLYDIMLISITWVVRVHTLCIHFIFCKF